MLVDVAKLLLLLLGYTLYGQPERWDLAWGVKLSVQAGVETSYTLELTYDPAPIFRAPTPPHIGGYALGGFAVVSSSLLDVMAEQAIQHEIEHLWQARTYGMLMILYPLAPHLWEPEPYEWGNLEGMPKPRALNWALFRIWIPLR